MKSCCVIMGPYRSGTSLASQIVSDLGFHFGPQSAFQLPPDRFNPGGYFQRKDIVEANRVLIDAISESISKPAHPQAILAAYGSGSLDSLDFSWMTGLQNVAIKDPRLSVTFLTWQAQMVLADRQIRLVCVTRDINAIARSSVNHREVGSFCHYQLDEATAMAEVYESGALWHYSSSGCPAFQLKYEALIRNPVEVITELANFLGVSDPVKIRCASRRVGKRGALWRHYRTKLSDPKLVLESARKTIGHWLGR